MRVEDRNGLIRRSLELGVLLEPTLTRPYRNAPGLLNADEPFDALEELSDSLVSVPIHQSLTARNLERIAVGLRIALAKR
jgi:hypothetical protein